MKKSAFRIGYGDREYAIGYHARPCHKYIGGRYVQILVHGNKLQDTLYRIAVSGRRLSCVREVSIL